MGDMGAFRDWEAPPIKPFHFFKSPPSLRNPERLAQEGDAGEEMGLGSGKGGLNPSNPGVKPTDLAAISI